MDLSKFGGVLDNTEQEKRESIVAHCRALNASGLNQGTSGNISIRHADGLLISPTSRPYDTLSPSDISYVEMNGTAHGPWKPSSEWRFHRDILQDKPEADAVVHAHPTACTSLAIHGRGIPAVHYMVAVFGGTDVRCAPYEIYGSAELSEVAVEALKDRSGCLLAHHGMITTGATLEQAFWRAQELEALAKQYLGALSIGTPPVLTDQQVQDVIAKISGYGVTS